MSLFITFEGGEGSGKSTQAHLLATALKKRGIPFILTYEPGDTEVGTELRKILLDRNRAPLSPKTEALLFAADRSEHVDNVIRPALARGEIVICDRYIASSVAYQAYAGGLGEKSIRSLSEWASTDLYPDVTFFLDIPPELGLKRVVESRKTRFEDKDVAFHKEVYIGFCAQVRDYWVTLNAREPREAIADKVEHKVLDLIKLKEEARQVMEEVYTRHIADAKTLLEQFGFTEEERQEFLRKAEERRNAKKTYILRSNPGCPGCNAAMLESHGENGDTLVFYCPNGHGELRVPRKL